MPHWRRDGRELFYQSADHHLMAVAITPGKDLHPSSPVVLFPMGNASDEAGYEVSPDGQRFLVGSAVPGSGDAEVIVNWMARLAKK